MRVPIIRRLTIRRHTATRPDGSKGQSLAEFALVLPVFMLISLIGLDFGRLFSGWVTLQQASRIAANFAAVNPDAWGNPGSVLRRGQYQDLITHEVQGINCDFPNPAPDPSFPDGPNVGGRAVVNLDCHFHLLTPIISAILPNPLATSASSVFVIRTGFTSHSTCTQQGNCPNPPLAAFGTVPLQSPGTTTTTITTGQTVQFANTSQGNPTAYSWNFGDGSPPVSDISPQHIYTNSGPTTLSFTVILQACNVGGCGTATGTIKVLSATPAPTANFYWCSSVQCPTQNPSPLVGPATVNFFDSSTGTPTSWSWTFGDGGTATTQNPAHLYASVATSTTYTITLVATNASGSNSVQKSLTISPPVAICQVPSFAGKKDPLVGGAGKWKTADVTTVWTTTAAAYNAAHGTNFSWTGGNFTGAIIYTGGSPTSSTNFVINTQSLTASSNQLCSSTITFTWQ